MTKSRRSRSIAGGDRPADRVVARHVLFLHDALSENGAVRLTLDLATRFERVGRAPAVFALHPVSSGSAVAPARVRTVAGVSGRERLRWALPLAFVRLLRACRSADVVVAGSEVGRALLLGFAAARLARKPFATVVHGNLESAISYWVGRAARPLTRWVHRHSDLVVCVSPGLVAGVLANGSPPDRVHVVVNGIDVRRIRELASREPIAVRSPPQVVSVGRLSFEKGFDILIRAHAEALRAGAGHELVIVGEGPLRGELEDLARALGVESSVQFLGFRPNPFPVIASATAFVLPSRWEGLPLALLEALALEVPVIAMRGKSGAEHILGDDDFGRLVEPESVTGLAEALRRHLADPTELAERASRGARHVERHHDRAAMAARYAELLDSAAR